MCRLSFGVHACRAQATPGRRIGYSGDNRDPSRKFCFCAFSVLSCHQTFDAALGITASRQPVCAVRRRREVQAPRGTNAFRYPGSCCVWICTSSRPFPLTVQAGLERVGVTRGILQCFRVPQHAPPLRHRSIGVRGGRSTASRLLARTVGREESAFVVVPQKPTQVEKRAAFVPHLNVRYRRYSHETCARTRQSSRKPISRRNLPSSVFCHSNAHIQNLE